MDSGTYLSPSLVNVIFKAVVGGNTVYDIRVIQFRGRLFDSRHRCFYRSDGLMIPSDSHESD